MTAVASVVPAQILAKDQDKTVTAPIVSMTANEVNSTLSNPKPVEVDYEFVIIRNPDGTIKKSKKPIQPDPVQAAGNSAPPGTDGTDTVVITTTKLVNSGVKLNSFVTGQPLPNILASTAVTKARDANTIPRKPVNKPTNDSVNASAAQAKPSTTRSTVVVVVQSEKKANETGKKISTATEPTIPSTGAPQAGTQTQTAKTLKLNNAPEQKLAPAAVKTSTKPQFPAEANKPEPAENTASTNAPVSVPTPSPTAAAPEAHMPQSRDSSTPSTAPNPQSAPAPPAPTKTIGEDLTNISGTLDSVNTCMGKIATVTTGTASGSATLGITQPIPPTPVSTPTPTPVSTPTPATTTPIGGPPAVVPGVTVAAATSPVTPSPLGTSVLMPMARTVAAGFMSFIPAAQGVVSQTVAGAGVRPAAGVLSFAPAQGIMPVTRGAGSATVHDEQGQRTQQPDYGSNGQYQHGTDGQSREIFEEHARERKQDDHVTSGQDEEQHDSHDRHDHDHDIAGYEKQQEGDVEFDEDEEPEDCEEGDEVIDDDEDGGAELSQNNLGD